MTSPFKRIHHIGIVVHDLDKTRAYYESLGVGPWTDYPHTSPYVELDVPNPAATTATREIVCDLKIFSCNFASHRSSTLLNGGSSTIEERVSITSGSKWLTSPRPKTQVWLLGSPLRREVGARTVRASATSTPETMPQLSLRYGNPRNRLPNTCLKSRIATE